MLPLQHAIRALVEEGLLPTELDNHYRLKQIGVCGWLQSRGIELRGARNPNPDPDPNTNPNPNPNPNPNLNPDRNPTLKGS